NSLSHGVMGAVGKLQVIERHTSRALVAAKLVKTQVGGQAIQPRTEGCLAVKLRQAQPCLEARLLDDIFGGTPANQAQCQAIYRVAVALDQLAERIAITGTREPHQLNFGVVAADCHSARSLGIQSCISNRVIKDLSSFSGSASELRILRRLRMTVGVGVADPSQAQDDSRRRSCGSFAGSG